ncbi:hypothetical protein RIF29_18304 [Crotalaria pallida]|uniref:Uncharacterized protein n=1 Tax=Crotalaria pallida TaxID=3830 RepID=A0AAN9FQL1_CROPI
MGKGIVFLYNRISCIIVSEDGKFQYMNKLYSLCYLCFLHLAYNFHTLSFDSKSLSSNANGNEGALLLSSTGGVIAETLNGKS